MAGRCVRSKRTVWNMSTTPSKRIRSNAVLRAMNTPVRPTPMLTSYSTHTSTQSYEHSGTTDSHADITQHTHINSRAMNTPVRPTPMLTAQQHTHQLRAMNTPVRPTPMLTSHSTHTHQLRAMNTPVRPTPMLTAHSTHINSEL